MQTTFFCYDLNTGLQVSTTDPNGQLTSFGYGTSTLRLTQINYPDQGETSICYTDTGGSGCSQSSSPPYEIVTTQKITSSASKVTLVQIDGLGRAHRQAVTNGENTPYDQVDTCFDVIGRVEFQSYPYQGNGFSGSAVCSGAGDAFAYDALSRPASLTHSDGTTILIGYTGRATSIQDEGNGSQRVNRISQVDGLGRLVSSCEVTSSTLSVGISGSTTPGACGQDIAATGFLTTYAYDALDNLNSVTQGPLNGRSFVYDSLSRLTSVTNPESGIASYTYDGDGNVLTRKDARNITTTYSYDSLNRVLTKVYSDGTLQANFQYDTSSDWGQTLANTVGRLSEEWTGTTSNPTAAIFSYDPMGRTKFKIVCTPLWCPSTTSSRYALDYGYDLLGDMTSETNGAGVTFTYAYNLGGRPTSLTSSLSDSNHPGTLFSNVHYVAAGSIASATFGNGINETKSYDSRLRLTNITDGSVYTLSIPTYAPNNNIQAANDTANGDWTYSYDAFDRLSASSENSGATAYSYAYDRFGNRWTQAVTAGSGSPSSLGFDSNNHIVSGYGVTYDAAGDVTMASGLTYFFDAEGRIIQVGGTLGTCSTATACYVYDAEGQRASKTTTAGTFDNLYDLSGNEITEDDSAGWDRGEVYFGQRHVATYENSTTYFAHSDWLGTERARSNTSGASVVTCVSLPFGDGLTCTAGDPSPLHFTGKQRDYESILDNFVGRYYSSGQGRFMSADPNNAGADPPNPQSWNMYSYVVNNPLGSVDPSGLYCVGQDGDVLNTDNNGVPINGEADCKTAGGFWITVNGQPNQTDTVTVSAVADNLLPTSVPLSSQTLIPPGAKDPCDNSTLSAAHIDPHQQIDTAQGYIAGGKIAGSSAPSPYGGNPVLEFLGGIVGYAFAVKTNGPNDDKNLPGHDPNNQTDVDAGNVSFGITCPYGAGFCQFMAGAYQTASGHPNPKGTLKTGFDTPSDNAAIQIGQAMRAAGCHE